MNERMTSWEVTWREKEAPTRRVLHLFHGGWGPSSVSATFFLHSSEEDVQLPQATLFSTHGNLLTIKYFSSWWLSSLQAGGSRSRDSPSPSPTTWALGGDTQQGLHPPPSSEHPA